MNKEAFLRWCWSSISSQSDFCMFLHIFSMKVWVRNPRIHPEVSRIDFGTFLNRFRSRCWYPCCIMLETFEWFVLSSLIFRYTFFTCLSSIAAKRSESVLEVVVLTQQVITSSYLCVPIDFLLHLLRLLCFLRCSIAPLHWFFFEQGSEHSPIGYYHLICSISTGWDSCPICSASFFIWSAYDSKDRRRPVCTLSCSAKHFFTRSVMSIIFTMNSGQSLWGVPKLKRASRSLLRQVFLVRTSGALAAEWARFPRKSRK